MDKKREKAIFTFPPYFAVLRFAPAMILFALGVRYSVEAMYNNMALVIGGAVFAIGQWVWLRDKHKADPEAILDISKANRYLFFALCLVGAGLAYFNQALLISSLTLVAGLGQFWFKPQPTAGDRIWHGFQSTILAIIGFMVYRPMMYVCLPLSLILAFDYMRLQKKENEARKESFKKQTKRKKKRKK